MDGKEKGVKVEQDHISALYHSSHSRGKQAVGSMVLLPDVVTGPGLRGAVGAQAVSGLSAGVSWKENGQQT